MTGPLTNTSATTARPELKEYYLWDQVVTGFGMRVAPNGRKTFVLKYRIGGGRGARQGKLTLGRLGDWTVSAARAEARRLKREAETGRDPRLLLRTTSDAAVTLADMLDRWEVEGAPYHRRSGQKRKPDSVAADIRRLNIHVRTTIGGTRLSALAPSDLKKLRTDIANGKTARSMKTKARGVSKATGGDGTAIATLRILKSALSWGVDEGLLATNPASQLRLPASRTVERQLSAEELQNLGEALDRAELEAICHPYAIAIIRLLALTGARRGEIEGLEWRHIDFERGALILDDTKTGRAAFPLAGAALALLSAIPRTGSVFVFPAQRGGQGYYRGLNKHWPTIRAAAGLSGVRLHDLRHNYASIGAATGLGLHVIGSLLGHKQASTTARYAHLANAPLRSAADAIGGHIADQLGLTNGRKTDG